MLNDNNRDDMKKSIFMIDPSIAKTNQQESTIHENYSENYGLSALGIRASSVRRNLSPTVLIEKAIRNGEGILTDTGALAVTTGKFTGRSPHDKYIVDTDGVHDVINWGEVNRPIGRDVFNAIKEEMIAFLGGHEVYVFDGFAGADPKYRRKFRVINELPSQNLFIRDLPNGKDTVRFSTQDASGSTSQAANVIEAVGAGSRLLLIDEDTSATNFMVRDELMAQVVSRDKEPITPFISRIRDLYERAGVSTILVAGSSGAFFHIADTVIQMDRYVPQEITAQAKAVVAAFADSGTGLGTGLAAGGSEQAGGHARQAVSGASQVTSCARQAARHLRSRLPNWI